MKPKYFARRVSCKCDIVDEKHEGIGSEGETEPRELYYTSIHIHRNLWGPPGHKDTCIITNEDKDRS